MTGPSGFHYQPFYCEENAWWLCAETLADAQDGTVDLTDRRLVAFIVNRFGHCPLAAQHAARSGDVIWWDYHCVVLDGLDRIWDLDTRLGLPLPAARWLAGSFPFIDRLPPDLMPHFRLIPAAEFRRDFASDRRHMRGPDGHWHHPPPPWPPIGCGHDLPRYVRLDDDGPGELLDWAAIHRRLERRRQHRRENMPDNPS
jgi:hypothetical protein